VSSYVRVILWLLLAVLLLPLIAVIVLTPFLGLHEAGTGVIAFMLFGLIALADKVTTALTITTSFDGGIPRSSVLDSRSNALGGEECANFTIVRLPPDAPAVPEDWVLPVRAVWLPTPAEMSIPLADCDLDAQLKNTLRSAQSMPGSFVMNASDGHIETWLYSAPHRIAAKATFYYD
jgi:hypothetical protein